MLCAALLALAALTPLASADLPKLKNDSAFESTYYQFVPTQSYESCDYISPRFDVIRHVTNGYKSYAEECDRPVYSFITPSNWMMPQKAGLIVDSDGTLIWHGKDFGAARNLQIQKYKGKDYLTFFQLEDFTGGHASGHYYMLDSHYRIFKKFDAGNGFRGDLHEFKITKDNTALITIYEALKVDLSTVTKVPFQNWVWDSLFQEIDLETDTVVFEWRASDHYNFSDDYRKGPELKGWYFSPWDWFHINSIDKDADGNYLMSSRHLTHIALISGKTGDVIWKLGGMKLNDFKDLSNGRATNFQYQHHASWAGDNEIVLFDNGINYEGTSSPYSRGMRIAIDVEAKTAKLVAEYIHPENISAETQGSYQILPNGNVLIGWGFVAAYTEYHPSGAVIVDTHFVPSAMFGRGGIASYRTFQSPWTGFPLTKPDVAIRSSLGGEDTIYVSWNGATEVSSWDLHHGNAPDKRKMKPFATFEKNGFETAFPVDSDAMKQFIQVVALDGKGKILRASEILDRTLDKALIKPKIVTVYYPWKWIIMKVVGILIGAIVLIKFRRQVLSVIIHSLRSMRRRKRV